jgi:hypothetical protein
MSSTEHFVEAVGKRRKRECDARDAAREARTAERDAARDARDAARDAREARTAENVYCVYRWFAYL